MKLHVSLFVLLIGLALAGCHHSGGYSATAVVKVIRLVPILPASGTRGELPEGMPLEMRIMESPDALSSVIADLKLDRLWARRLNKGEALSKQDALAYLTPRLKLENQTGTNVIGITVTDEDPRGAAQIANAIADRYKTWRDYTDEQLAKSGIEVLKDQIAQQERNLKSAQSKAAQNLTASDLLNEQNTQQKFLDALEGKLQQDVASIQRRESPVKILSRAVPPPE